MSESLKDKPNYCQQCDKQFQCTSSYKIHMDKHAGKRYTCDICDKSYTASHSLTVHKRTHSDSKPYKCQYCLTAFKQSGHCLRHEKSCLVKSSTSSSIEGEKCNVARKMSSTMKRPKCKSKKAMIVCSICKSMFTCLSSYRVHEKKHQGVRHYCTRCAKSFTTYSQLRSHERDHDHVTNYSCDQCDKTFNRKSNLVRHKHLHQGKHRHVCHVCGKSFILLEGFTAHLKSHENLPSAWCNICGASFKFLSSLKTHQKMHANKKDFKCEICDREFLRKRTLEDHMKVHNKGSKHKALFEAPTEFCKMCSKGFSNKYGLQRHLRKHRLGLLKTYNRIQLKNSEDRSNKFETPACGYSKARTRQIHINKEIPQYYKIDPVYFQDEDEIVGCTNSANDNEAEIDDKRNHVIDNDIDGDNVVNHFDTESAGVHDEDVITDDTTVTNSLIECENSVIRSHIECESSVNGSHTKCEKSVNKSYIECENSENCNLIECENSVNGTHIDCESSVNGSDIERENSVNGSHIECEKNVNGCHIEFENNVNRSVEFNQEMSIDQLKEIYNNDNMLVEDNINISKLNESIIDDRDVEINITAPGCSVEQTVLPDESKMVFVVHNQVMVPIEVEGNEPFEVIQQGEYHVVNENSMSVGLCQDLISTAAHECDILPPFKESFVNVQIVPNENTSVESIMISENYIDDQSSELKELNKTQHQVTSETSLNFKNNNSLNEKIIDKLTSCKENDSTKQFQKAEHEYNSKQLSVLHDKYEKKCKETNFECRYCLSKYANRKSLNTHLKRYHKDGECKIYKCDDCNMMFASKLIYFNHLDHHKLKGKALDNHKYCDICGAMFTSCLSYNRHRRMRHFIFDDTSVEIDSKREKHNHITVSGSKRHNLAIEQKTKGVNDAREATGNNKESECYEQMNKSNLVDYNEDIHDSNNTDGHFDGTDHPCGSNIATDNVDYIDKLFTARNKTKCRVPKTQMKFRQRFPCPKCNKSFHMKYSRRQHMLTHSKSRSCHAPGNKIGTNKCSNTFPGSEHNDTSENLSSNDNIDMTAERRHNDKDMLNDADAKLSKLVDQQVKVGKMNAAMNGIEVSEEQYFRREINLESELDKARHLVISECKLSETSNNLEGNITMVKGQVAKESKKGNCTEDTKFNCHKCDKEFDTKLEKLSHIKDAHGFGDYLCENCPKKFTTMTNLRRHIDIHHGKDDGNLAKNYMCTQCGKCYTVKDSLRIHMFTHTGERHYKCDQCDASYFQSGHLQRHIRCAHIKQKMFKCKHAGCSKSFYDQSGLTMHSKSHTDVRQFQCNVCQKCFKTSDVLNRHMKTHQDNEKFECHICSQKLSTKVCLMRHLKRHEISEKMNPNSASYDPSVNMRVVKKMEEKKYQCEHCLNKFTTIRGMNAHQQKFCRGIKISPVNMQMF
ncbi:Transcription factor IIIA [Mactra antiquata]